MKINEDFPFCVLFHTSNYEVLYKAIWAIASRTPVSPRNPDWFFTTCPWLEVGDYHTGVTLSSHCQSWIWDWQAARADQTDLITECFCVKGFTEIVKGKVVRREIKQDLLKKDASLLRGKNSSACLMSKSPRSHNLNFTHTWFYEI